MTNLIATFLVTAALGGGPDAAAARVTLLHQDAARPAASEAADPADSVYRAAREALNRGDYRRSAQLFQRVASRWPDADVAGDALYWQAYALYRQGGSGELKSASKALKAHKEKYPKARTRGDADALATRIDGQLARMGDAGSAERIGREADRAATARDCPREDDDNDMRIAALNALMQMDAERAMPVLKQVLARRDACSAPLRRKAVFVVSQKRGADTEDILLNAVRTDPDREVREQAVFWLGQVHTQRAVTALDSILRNADDAELRDKALFAITQQRGAQASAVLRRVIDDTVQAREIREKAVFWLGQQRSAENAQYLRQLFDRTQSSEMREKIMFSLGQMRGEGNDEWLLGIVGNKRYSIETRKQALFNAGQNGASAEKLVGLWSSLDDREMKEQLLFVMHDRRGQAAIDKMIDIAKNEKDVELRKKAIFWLGQSRDPRVQQLLVDIINQ
jgi:HEAT repeat protein